MILLLIRKEIFRHPVNKGLLLLGILMLLISCKALRTDADTHYDVLNTVLDSYVKHDSIYLYPKVITLGDKKIKEFEMYGIDIDTCNGTIKNIILNADKSITTEETWKYSKIKNRKVITRLTLKRPASIKKYKKLAETTEDTFDLLDRKFMLWTLEHNEGMLRLSYPIFDNKGSHALMYVSKYNDGEFVLALKRETKKDWNIICKKRLSHY